MEYNPTNVFARILNGEISCDKIAEGEHFLAFEDLYPKAPVHILIIPKGPYIDAHHFHTNASDAEIIGFYKGVSKVIESQGLEEKGFRLIANAGEHGQQEVFHYHVHLVGGRKLGAKVVTD
jgi:diadenosine tetraphosphate (Ap4A) HIT family hydrolase